MDGIPPNSDARNSGKRLGPWTQLSVRETYDNPWIRVREDGILRPDGSPGIYGVIHYKNLAIGVVAIDAQGRVILVGQHRYPFDHYTWEIAEGGCPVGTEDPEVAAERELREETGYTAARWDYLGTMEVSNSTSDELAHFYLARELTPGPAEPDETEELAIKLLDFDQAYRQAMEGGLTESLTVAGLARAHYFLACERREGPKPPRKR